MNTFLITLFLLIGGIPDEPVIDKEITCDVVNQSFCDFAKFVQEQTNIKIYFDSNQTQNIKVTLKVERSNLISVLKEVLKGTTLEVSVWHNSIIIVDKDRLISSLPNFEESVRRNEASNQASSRFTESEMRYVSGRKADVVNVIQVGEYNSSKRITNARIMGKVIDQETGEPIIGATIFIEENGKGTVTDKNGIFSIALPPQSYNCKVECLGFKKSKVQLNVYSNGDLNIELVKEALLIDEVQVYGDAQSNRKVTDIGLEILSPKTIKEIPMMMGEKDILKVSSLLPGIISIGEGTSGFNVRGGSADQNAFYINKVPVYNTSHLFGFFPAFNSDVIKDFSVYKGYVPSNYGGKLSSIFNIITRQGNRKQFTVHGGVNPITANLTVEGPIIKDTLTILFNARKSYSDWILSRIKDSTVHNSSTAFNDFCASINYDLKKTQTSVFIYNSNDNFSNTGVNSFFYSNSGGSFNVRHVFNTSFRSDVAIIGSKYTFKTTDQQVAATAYKHKYDIEHYEFRCDFSHLLNEKISLEYGLNSTLYMLSRGIVKPYGLGSSRTPVDLGKEKGMDNSIYISGDLDLLSRVKLTAGVRYSIFTPLGSRDEYVYDNNSPREINSIIDTLTFKNNKPIKWYHSPEYRAALNFETDRRGSIKLAYSSMQQNLFMLNNSFSISPNTQWKLADYNIKPSTSNQVSIGIFRNFPKRGWEASVECYYKKTKNYPEFRDGASFLDNPNIETAVLQGDQKAYGVEVLIKRKNRKLEGWLSYTYSRSIVEIDGKNPWDRINDGDPYPANFDVPHALNAIVNYHFSRRVALSTVFTYQSGRPITYPVSVFYVNGVPYYDYSKRNKYNIPDYFRIDASLSLEGNLKKRKLVHSSLLFSVYNLMGRKNPYSVYFKTEEGLIKSYKYSIIGVPIFTVTWQFKMGNYASD